MKTMIWVGPFMNENQQPRRTFSFLCMFTPFLPVFCNTHVTSHTLGLQRVELKGYLEEVKETVYVHIYQRLLILDLHMFLREFSSKIKEASAEGDLVSLDHPNPLEQRT